MISGLRLRMQTGLQSLPRAKDPDSCFKLTRKEMMLFPLQVSCRLCTAIVL